MAKVGKGGGGVYAHFYIFSVNGRGVQPPTRVLLRLTQCHVIFMRSMMIQYMKIAY